MGSKKKILSLIDLSAIVILVFTIGSVLAVRDSTNAQTAMPQPAIPQPQGFCGYCHILTYPTIIDKSYTTWKQGKHNSVGCVECHYPPKETKPPEPVKTISPKESDIHISKAPPGDFTYLELGGGTMSTRPRIADAGCMTLSCHGKPDDPFKTKKIAFTEKVPFVHEPHLEKKNQIEGMQVNCTTCHQRETGVKHFQVADATCHLCHFANTTFNRGRARCEICHDLPKEPIQTSDDPDRKPITHQMLKEAKVSCSSCHFELVRGAGDRKVEPVFENGLLKTVLVVGAGRLKEENCLNCHDQVAYLKKMGDKKEMHQSHVNVKNARCLDCHRPIQHRKAKTNQFMPDDCKACHLAPHSYQRLLAAGPERDGIPHLPDPMFKARTNCLGCHVEKDVTHKGQSVMKASARTCVQCHTGDYEKMLGLWKREIGGEVEKAKRLELDAVKALEKYRSEIAAEKLDEAGNMLKKARENLRIVQFGNGVHNAKYSVELLDAAMTSFKDVVGFLEGKDMSEGIVQEE